MGIFDKIKDAAGGHEDEVNQGIDKAGDVVDEKTEGKYAAQVDQGQDFAKQQIGTPADAPSAETPNPAPEDQPEQ